MHETSELIDRVDAALAAGERDESKLTEGPLSVPGFCSPHIRHFFNNVAGYPDTRYCEVGTFRGASIVAAAFENSGHFTAIDNFSSTPKAIGQSREILLANLAASGLLGSVDFREGCGFLVSDRLDADSVNTFYYDGHHGEGSTAYAFVKFRPVLTSPCIVVIDDYLWPKVTRGVRAGLAIGKWSIAREWVKQSPGTGKGGETSWWNGLWVGVLEKQ
jgi:hypothetical protein